MEVALCGRVTDFFLGLNAGVWLRLRLLEILERGAAAVAAAKEPVEAPGLDALLAGTGFVQSAAVEAPPADASATWNFWGPSGNAKMEHDGVSSHLDQIFPD